MKKKNWTEISGVFFRFEAVYMFFHLTSLNHTAWRNLDIWNYLHIEIPVFFVTHATFVLRMGSLIPSHIPILVHVLSVQHSLVCVCHLWLCGCKCVFPRGYSLCRPCFSRRGLDTFYWLSSIQLSALPSYLPSSPCLPSHPSLQQSHFFHAAVIWYEHCLPHLNHNRTEGHLIMVFCF